MLQLEHQNLSYYSGQGHKLGQDAHKVKVGIRLEGIFLFQIVLFVFVR